MANKDYVLKFRRNTNGKLDLKHGTYSSETLSQTRCKFTEEVRLCLGAGCVTPVVDGAEQKTVGVRCNPFVYSGKTLLLILD